MSGKRHSDEFKAEAAKQVIDQGRSVREVSTRLGVSIDSLYAWVRDHSLHCACGGTPQCCQQSVSLTFRRKHSRNHWQRMRDSQVLRSQAIQAGIFPQYAALI